MKKSGYHGKPGHQANGAVERAGQTTERAGQAASQAFRSDRDAAAKAIEVGTDAIRGSYDDTVGAARETMQRTVPRAIQSFDQLAGVHRANFEAWFAATRRAMKGVESFGEEVMAFNQRAIESGWSGVQRLLGCRTLQEAAETQADVARSSIEAALEQGSRLSELAVRTATDVAEPLRQRMSQVAEKMGLPRNA